MADDYVLGVDLGGTRIRAALFRPDLTLVHRRETLTQAHRGYKATIDHLRTFVADMRTLVPGATIRGVGISAPGPVNPKAGLLVAPPNLPGWHNVPLAALLEDVTDCPAYLGNDANVAGLAETTRGAARGCREVIFITVSTGIGGGIITNGQMLLGVEGLGAEVGHIPILIGDTVTTLEKEAAGPALARQARARISAGESSMMLDLVDGVIDAISGSTVGQAALAGDPLALAIVARGGMIIGLGVVGLLHVFNPQIIVFGGGVSTLGDLLLDPVRQTVQRYTIDPAYWQRLRIVPAALGEDVSLVGAASLVLTRGGIEDIAQIAAQIGAD